jgi:hypothetical protein
MDYFDSIKLYHSFVSFSTTNQTFYISLWNGILRDGIIDDIDITFFEAKHPTIFNHSLLVNEKCFNLSILQFNFLSNIFTH